MGPSAEPGYAAVVNNSGTIKGSTTADAIGVNFWDHLGSISLTNSGLIEGQNMGVFNGTVTTGMTLVNEVGGVITGLVNNDAPGATPLAIFSGLVPGGVAAAGANFDDMVTNHGTLNGSVFLGLGNDTFTNTGTVNGIAILSPSGTMVVTNSGIIRGDPGAAVVGGGGTVTNSGLLSGGSVGITHRVDPSSGPMTLTITNTNTGTIEGTGDGDFLGGNPDNSVGILTKGGAGNLVVDNAGLITSPGSAIASMSGITVTNQAAGIITGDSNASGANYAIWTQDDVLRDELTAPILDGGGFEQVFSLAPGDTSLNDTVTNHGTINGNIALGYGDDTLINTSSNSINGNIDLGSGNDTLTNTGTIDGDVDLGEGDDSLTIEGSGVITGHVDGGNGTDTLVINTDGIVEIASFDNFQSLTKIGGGGLAFGSDAEVGELEVDAGEIDLQDVTLTGEITVSGSGTLVGNGTIVGDVIAFGGGSIAPGNSIGSINISGTYAVGPTTTTEIEFTETAVDSIIVTGNAAIDGTLELVPLDGTPILGTFSHTFLTATTGVTGTFATVDIGLNSNYLVTMDYGPNSTGFSVVTDIGNGLELAPQHAAMTAWMNTEANAGGLTGSLHDGIAGLAGTTGQDLVTGLGQVSAQTWAATPQLGLDLGHVLARDAERRLADRRKRHDKVWLSWFDNNRLLGGDSAIGTAETEIEFSGFVGGVDVDLTEHSVLGSFAAFVTGRQSLDQYQSGSDYEATAVGGYYGFERGTFQAGLVAARNTGDLETVRVISAMGMSERGEAGTVDTTLHAFVSFLADHGKTKMRPHAGLTVIKAERSALVETNDTGLGLRVEKQEADSVVIDLGLEVSRLLRSGRRGDLSLDTAFGLRYDFVDDPDQAVARFSGMTAAMVSSAAERDQGEVYGSARLTKDLSEDQVIYLQFEASAGENSNRRRFSLGLSRKF